MNKLVTPADSVITQLSENIGTVATAIKVADTSGFPASGWLSVGALGSREIMEYTTIDGNVISGITRSGSPRSFQIGSRVSELEWMPVIAEGQELATQAEIDALQAEIDGFTGGGLSQPQVMARTLGC